MKLVERWEELVMTLAEQWGLEGYLKGKKAGRKEGRLKGRQEALPGYGF